MVKHDVLVRGVDMQGTTHSRPVLLQMHDTDFPSHFLRDLANPGQTEVSSTTVIASSAAHPATLFQPVQRIVHLAMVQLNCDTLAYPPLATTRVESAGLVIRRVYRKPATPKAIDEFKHLPLAWMQSPGGTFDWVRLKAGQERLDPDPSKRPQLQSGQTDLDLLLAAMSLSQASTEVFTPAFVAKPDICNALGRTIVYALIPTASSEVSDTQPSPPQYDRNELARNLPPLLTPNAQTPILSGQSVNSNWMSDDFLAALFPPPDSAHPNVPDGRIAQFQAFTTALRMLQSVFGAFDDTPEGQKILQVLNRRHVTQDGQTKGMGDFYADAATKLLGVNGSAGGSFDMPTAWEMLTSSDQDDLLTAVVAAITPQCSKVLAPQGRFQDSSRFYTARVFLRIKPENPACPTQLIWSLPSEPFRIAAWYEAGGRPHPPIALPDTSKLRDLAKPNASFHVPASLMNSMQGSSLSGMMKGSGGGGGITIDWICGFSIPFITICAFFVLNIFFSLLAIIFFWLPFFKICIPIPVPKPSDGDH
jgi:hypothetical protein